ncbi:MAG: hypothetical protein ACYCVB_12515 [Bacilli bacterium]
MSTGRLCGFRDPFGNPVSFKDILWRRTIARDATFLVASHRPVVLRIADQILFMENGRIAARGSREELRATCAGVLQLWGDGF